MSSILPLAVDVDQLEFARRNKLTQRLALVFAGIIALVLLLGVTARQFSSALLLNELLMLALFGLAAWATLWRRSRFAPELLVTTTLLHGVTESFHSAGVVGQGPMVCFVALGLAGMLVSWRANLIFGALAIGAVFALAVLAAQGVSGTNVSADTTSATIYTRTAVYALLFAVVCAISCINARSHEQSLRHLAAQSAATTAQNEQLIAQGELVRRQATELEQHRSRLEQEVADRTVELSQALADLRQNAVALRELESPLVPIADGVLVMPLVGALDSVRAAQFVQSLLRGIQQRRAHIVLLDVTGLPALDTLAAQTLLQASCAAKLLGANVRLVGVTPAVAQTIVGLGLDLSTLRVERDLQSAVANVLGQQAASGDHIRQRCAAAAQR